MRSAFFVAERAMGITEEAAEMVKCAVDGARTERRPVTGAVSLTEHS